MSTKAKAPAPPRIVGLGHVPPRLRRSSPYIWADYIEQLCLADADHVIAKADVLDRIAADEDLRKVDALSQEDIESDYDSLPDEYKGPDADLDFRLGEPPGPSAKPEHPAERHDREEAQVDLWFRHLAYRSDAFREFYPFRLEEDVLYRKQDIAEDPCCRLYIFLLSASNLGYFEEHHHHYITDRFELVSLAALRKLLPQRAQVRLVGTNGLNQGRYKGTCWHKIETLSGELGEDITDRCRKGKAELQDQGDRGLDVAGWTSLGDNMPHRLLLLGQCACGAGWKEKQLEAHVARWRTFLSFTVPPSSLLFIPHCFREADGRWFRITDIEEVILLDRLRLVHLLRSHLPRLRGTLSFDQLVDQVLGYVEPPV